MFISISFSEKIVCLLIVRLMCVLSPSTCSKATALALAAKAVKKQRNMSPINSFSPIFKPESDSRLSPVVAPLSIGERQATPPPTASNGSSSTAIGGSSSGKRGKGGSKSRAAKSIISKKVKDCLRTLKLDPPNVTELTIKDKDTYLKRKMRFEKRHGYYKILNTVSSVLVQVHVFH